MPKIREVTDDLQALDTALYAAVARTRTPALDAGLRHLSTAADHSKISLAVAGLLALHPGRTRRAALLGCASVVIDNRSINWFVRHSYSLVRPQFG